MIALAAGAAVLVAALGPWAEHAADETLSAHMLQHLALALVAAPLLGAGAPRLLRLLPRAVARAAVRVAHPLIGCLVFSAVQLTTHLTGLYDLAAGNQAVHVLEHALFLGGALLLWAPVLDRKRGVGRLLAVVGAMPSMAIVGAVLASSAAPRYAHYPSLADQHRAAAVMWVAGSLALVAALAAVAWDWIRTEERRAVAHEGYGL